MKKKLDIHQGGFKRENKSHKIDYTLIPLEQLKKLAQHYTEGAKVHGRNNWVKSQDLETFKQSAFRHFMQWMQNEQDESHSMALVWNIFCYEHLKDKLDNKK